MYDFGALTTSDIIQSLYIAYYGRPAESGGLDWWTGQLDQQGRSLQAVVTPYATSTEFNTRYGQLDYGGLVDTAYQQLFGHAPDTGGRDYYINLLQSGATTRQLFVLDIMGGAQNDDLAVLQNRLTAANGFSARATLDTSLYSDIEAAAQASAILQTVTSSPTSLTTFSTLQSELFTEWAASPAGVSSLSTSGTIDYTGDRDSFGITLTAGSTYLIRAEQTAPGALDPVIVGVRDAAGNLLAEANNDNYATSLNAQLSLTAALSGEYFVQVEGANGSVGPYALNVSDLSAASEESGTTQVSSGVVHTGQIESSFTVDKLTMTLTGGQEYTLTLQPVSSGNTLDNPAIRGVYDSQGKQVAGTQVETQTGQVQIRFTPVETGDYTAWVADVFDDIGGYTFVFNPDASGKASGKAGTSRSSGDIPDDTTSTADVVVNGSVLGNIETQGDSDCYRVELTSGYGYTFDLRGSGSGYGTLYDPLINGIYDAYGNYLTGTYSDDVVGRDARVTFTPTVSGTYFIGADAYGSYTGTYTLSVTESTYDPPASTATTASIEMGESETGTIDVAHDQDWFAVSLLASNTYSIQLQGSSSDQGDLTDPVIEGVYDAQGNYLWNTYADGGYTSSGSYSYLDAQLSFTPDTSGAYYIAAAGWGAQTGSYTLNIELSAQDIAANTNTTGTISIGASMQGEIGNAQDEDWYAISLQAGHTYLINIQGHASGQGSLADPEIQGIYDAEGCYIWGTYADGGYNSAGDFSYLDAQLSFTPSTDGIHYISAGGWSGGTGTYTLGVIETSGSGDIPDDTTTSSSVPVNFWVEGNIEISSDRDWHAAQLEAGHRYRIDLLGSGTNHGDLSDPYFYGVYDASGNLLPGTSDDDSGEGMNSQNVITVSTTGTYYLSAGGYGVNTGTYRLALSQLGQADIAADVSTTEILTPGASATGTIDETADQDWFAANLVGGTTYSFTLDASTNSLSPLADPFLRGIFDSQGTFITGTTDDDSGEGVNALVVFTPTSSSVYYISAGAYGGNTGDYVLGAAYGGTATSGDATADIAASISTLGSVNTGGSTNSQVDVAGDRDWFAISLSAGTTYDITLAGSPSGAGTLSDTYFYGIHDTTGNLIANTQNDDYGGGRESFISFSPTSTGTYYLSAGGYGNTTGSYALSVAAVSDQTPTQVDPGSTPSQGTTGDWTVMVYIAGDNNLEQFGLADINEMEAASLPGNVRVSVLIDRAPGHSAADGNWTDTRVGLISQDSNMNRIVSDLTSWGEQNTGSQQTLTNFINTSAQLAPADHYALVVWDHGGGIAGVAWDDSNNGANLSLNEVSQAIAASSVTHFDLIGFDACLQGVLDQAYILRSQSDYQVFSEDLEPGEGWDYTSWLSIFGEQANVSTLQLANRAVDTYEQYYQEQGNNTVTLSAIQSSEASDLANAWSTFAQAVVSAGSLATQQVEQAISQATRFNNDYVDLYDLMQGFSTLNQSLELDLAAQNVMTAIGDAVLNTGGLAAARGITVYFPEQLSHQYSSAADFPLLTLPGVAALYDAIWA